MTTRETFIALNRFGLGAQGNAQGDAQGSTRESEWRAAAADPRRWLARQLAGPARMPAALSGLPSAADALRQFQEARRGGAKSKNLRQMMRRSARASYIAEAGARTRARIESQEPFRERLVAFWSNHFTVSVRRPVLMGLAGAFEREAIRPHVTGRFAEMLLAVVRHPAMLLYLDNVRSIGPGSRAGRRRGKGLNENLAREALELHTLGVDGGYTQEDVVAFAKILTGWSVARLGHGDAGTFAFHEAAHEPGAKRLLGKRYGEDGLAEGEAALRDLARHPATATHIATKLARHFIADQPPPRVVARLAGVFRDTDGDLGAMARALVATEEAWAAPLAKIKTADGLVVSALRATGFNGNDRGLVGSLKMLGQAPFAAPSPAGWPDTAADWIGPGSVLRRAEWASAVGRHFARAEASQRLFEATIAPVAGPETQAAVARAPSVSDAVALILSSPEFQRR